MIEILSAEHYQPVFLKFILTLILNFYPSNVQIPTIYEMDLAYRNPLETTCHTLDSKIQLNSYMYEICVATILDFSFYVLLADD